MPKDVRQLQDFYRQLDKIVAELIDVEFAAEVKRVRRALQD